ncbi:MAG TPA: nicotinate-nucleotide--dimethylbenzimidazole phosphoribosyltransferase [Longimicrobium sp.]|jgi:nicotinate-nucleotide--dimethylbenzimidazole phosphoribosyltransferase|uniref:nicotinate-nucleotide--dimethylbenzimidazole phosphoribosyltransferase n=1 Tax=Longimicrobium sp. TaxID=2029185 RepID=UPI002ED7FEF1
MPIPNQTDWLRRAQAALDDKTKPLGSLGRLEAAAARMAALQQTLAPAADRCRALVFAGDHGIADEGVSAYPRAVTTEMLRNFARGGAAVTVLARALGAGVDVVDVGVDAEFDALEGIAAARVRRGTRNFAHEPAMTADELGAAMRAGRDAVRRAARDGVQAVALGEMGIANTTAAAALLSALTGADPADTVGRGTGVDDDQLEHKRAVVARALAMHGVPSDAAEALATFGGLEMAAVAGAALEAPLHRMAVVVDGFIATVSVLAAVRMDPAIAPALFLAHRSAERGHAVALDALAAAGCDAEPLLDLGMRLGEASGAVLAFPLLRGACALFGMASFAEAGVSGPVVPEAVA